MPRLTIKNKSLTLVSLSIGQIGRESQRNFDLSRTRLDGIHRELSRLKDAGQIDFWTDAAISPSFDEGDEALRGKAAEIDELQQKAAEISGLRREWASALGLAQQELKEIRAIKDVWRVKSLELSGKISEMDTLLRKAREVEVLLDKAQEVDSLLARTEEVNLLWDKVNTIDSVLAKADEIEELRATAESIGGLHHRLSARVATPLSDVVRTEATRLISCSQKEANLISDMVLDLPSAGAWLISFEAVMHSPAPAQGFIVMSINGEVTERPTGKLHPDGANPPVFMTETCEVPEGSSAKIMWRSSKGSMRMTTRKITAMKVSSCVR